MKRFQNFRFKTIASANETQTIAIDDLAEFATIWNNSLKMVLVGVNEPNSVSDKTVEALANDNCCFTETTSNLHHPSFINNIDTIITPFTDEDFKDFCPDVLVTLRNDCFKRIKAFEEIQAKTSLAH
jgi:2-succinyl-5-enolpyruvyl-6-hydroxy-3-cyclohexene-1-carboxylate synthase